MARQRSPQVLNLFLERQIELKPPPNTSEALFLRIPCSQALIKLRDSLYKVL